MNTEPTEHNSSEYSGRSQISIISPELHTCISVAVCMCVHKQYAVCAVTAISVGAWPQGKPGEPVLQHNPQSI